MDVSVIIVNYNTRKLTGECIDSIFEKTSGITFEVIVVDNASQDDSIEIFRKDPRIIFIENTENQGFGKANNLGISDKIESKNTHGTGCTLSSAIATFLALGYDMPQAVEHAKAYVTKGIHAGKDVHIGEGHGPLQ